MNIIRAYIAYIKDNPEGYWFKRKAYGWGWTPATREGWLTTLLFLTFVIAIAWRAENTELTPAAVWFEVIIPMVVAVIFLIGICYLTGQSPRWQWRLPKKYYKD